MKVNWTMSIGYPGAKRHGEIYIDDEELEGKSKEEIDKIISEEVWEDAAQYVDTYWEIEEE